jgi:raffinose/stachyose/melibiose transport system permease protein
MATGCCPVAIFMKIRFGRREESVTSLYIRKAGIFTLFTIPALALVLLFTEIPFFMNMYYAFTKWNGLSRHPEWIGFRNFVDIFTNDDEVWPIFKFTIKFTVYNTIIVNVIAFFLALILNQGLRTRHVLRTLFFIPVVLSLLISALIWKFIFTNAFNSLYSLTHIDFFNWPWLSSPGFGLTSILIVSAWKNIGFFMVIYLAGLQGISKDVLECADLDGAIGLRKVWYIILPLIMPAVTICIFLSLIGGLNLFDVPFAMTNGGPGYVTTPITMNIFNDAFRDFQYGYGTAKSLLFFIFSALIAFLQVYYSKKKEVEL